MVNTFSGYTTLTQKQKYLVNWKASAISEALIFPAMARLIILSADFEGRSDLFLLSSKRDRVRRLTNDLYDDLDPALYPIRTGLFLLPTEPPIRYERTPSHSSKHSPTITIYLSTIWTVRNFY